MFRLLVLLAFPSLINCQQKIPTLRQIQEVRPADCKVSVLRDGPNGEVVSSTTLDTELYYKVDCRPRPDSPADKISKENLYCLSVFNCTVSNGRTVYPIIDEHGCTLEPFLFDNVEYESDLVAGIMNPYPVRFRGARNRIAFNCVTSLFLKGNSDCDEAEQGDNGSEEAVGALAAQFEVQPDVKGITVGVKTVTPSTTTTTVAWGRRRGRRQAQHMSTRRGCNKQE